VFAHFVGRFVEADDLPTSNGETRVGREEETMADGLTGVAFELYDRVNHVGRPLANICLAIGYGIFAAGFIVPDALQTILDIIPDSLVLPIGYLITFAYPAIYALLTLVAAYSAVTLRSEGTDWTRADRGRIYLAIAFGEWSTHHLLYLMFPATLFWGLLSLVMGVAYAVPVWSMLCIAAVGVIVGNQYMWYYDPEELPSDATPDE